jgi:cation diffusion facilitator family transporter
MTDTAPTPAKSVANLTQRAAWASVAAALVLVGLKAWGQTASGSAALLASLADSALDLVASVVTLLSVRYAASPPDAEHRFGHGKAEALAGVFQAGLVALSAVLIAWTAIDRLIAPRPLQQEGVALTVMAVSLLVTGALVAYQSWTVRRTGSIATKGDRAHYLADFASNAAALVGIVLATRLGWLQADALAGLFVAAWLAHGAWGVASEAADHLLDREAPDETRARIRALALADPAILGVHDLRTRMSGPWLHVQMHVDVESGLTLVAAHALVVAAEARIRGEFPGADILIHPDPVDLKEPHGHPAFGERRGEVAT